MYLMNCVPAQTFQYPLGGSWGCNALLPAAAEYRHAFQYPLGGSWGCNCDVPPAIYTRASVSVSSGWIVGV